MQKFLNVVDFLFSTSWNKTKMQYIYTNAENLIKLERLAYLKFYSNVSTLKVMDVQRQRCDQPQNVTGHHRHNEMELWAPTQGKKDDKR